LNELKILISRENKLSETHDEEVRADSRRA